LRFMVCLIVSCSPNNKIRNRKERKGFAKKRKEEF